MDKHDNYLSSVLRMGKFCIKRQKYPKCAKIDRNFFSAGSWQNLVKEQRNQDDLIKY